MITEETFRTDPWAFVVGEPGIYPGIPAETYHKLDACSASRLKMFARSPLHCHYSSVNPMHTDAMLLGEAVHLHVLEPGLFNARYVGRQLCVARKKDGGFCANQGAVEHRGQWFCGVHDPGKKGITIESSGRIPLSQEDIEACAGCYMSVHSHPRARDLLEGDGPTELSIVWIDSDTGLLCKARFDKLNTAVGAICDLKTTPSAQRSAFMRKLYGFGYHIQAALYLQGAKSHGLDANHFIFIPVEKSAPNACAVYRLKDEVIEAGTVQARELMRGYARCVESGKWPGYGDQIEDIDLPAWDWRQLSED